MVIVRSQVRNAPARPLCRNRETSRTTISEDLLREILRVVGRDALATEPRVDQGRIEVNQPLPRDGIRPIVQPLQQRGGRLGHGVSRSFITRGHGILADSESSISVSWDRMKRASLLHRWADSR